MLCKCLAEICLAGFNVQRSGRWKMLCLAHNIRFIQQNKHPVMLEMLIFWIKRDGVYFLYLFSLCLLLSPCWIIFSVQWRSRKMSSEIIPFSPLLFSLSKNLKRHGVCSDTCGQFGHTSLKTPQTYCTGWLHSVGVGSALCTRGDLLAGYFQWVHSCPFTVCVTFKAHWKSSLVAEAFASMGSS